ncbi:hypothetical protein H0N96_02105, partial [Candidatus Micrarchaeota archaeon]|nr:hypothetical protein [Candidatus Micrarchaeota archaeon]
CFNLGQSAVFALSIICVTCLALASNALTPPGDVIITPGVNETYSPTPFYYNYSFSAGGYTQLTPGQTQQSEVWQGFYGNISAIVGLANAAGQSFYNWSVLNVSGMIYATTSDNPSWGRTSNDVSASTVDALWGFGAWSDNATQTFTPDGNTAFTVGAGSGSVDIAANTRDFMNTFSGGLVIPGAFEEVLLTDSNAQTLKISIIFASFVGNLKTSFNSSVQTHYQIIVPNNQRNATALDTYYLYFQLN